MTNKVSAQFFLTHSIIFVQLNKQQKREVDGFFNTSPLATELVIQREAITAVLLEQDDQKFDKDEFDEIMEDVVEQLQVLDPQWAGVKNKHLKYRQMRYRSLYDMLK